MTETMPARWDRATANTLTRLRETTGRPVSFLVTQAILHAARADADLTEYFGTPARGQTVRTTVTLHGNVAGNLDRIAAEHPSPRGVRSRYAVVRACVRWWLDTDVDDLSTRLGGQWLRVEASHA